MNSNPLPKMPSSPSEDVPSSSSTSKDSIYCIVTTAQNSDGSREASDCENSDDRGEDNQLFRNKSSIKILDNNDEDKDVLDLEWMDDKALFQDMFFGMGNNLSENENDVNKEINSEIDHEAQEVDENSEKIALPNRRNRPSSCVFVASLSFQMTDVDLHESVKKCFEGFGKVSWVKVLRDHLSRPYAFVQYDNDEVAKNAIEKGQHVILNDRPIRCEPAKINRTLFLFPLRTGNSDRIDIEKLLQPYGELEELNQEDLSFRNRVEASRKCWIAKFAFREDAIRAYSNLLRDLKQSSIIHRVEWAQNSQDVCYVQNEMDYNSIFIKFLSQNITVDDLVKRFSQYGNILHCNIVAGNSFNSTGANPRNAPFAFITFDNDRSSAEAINQENYSIFEGSVIHVRFKENKKRVKADRTEMRLAPPPLAEQSFRNRMYSNGRRRTDFQQNFGNIDPAIGITGYMDGDFDRRGTNFDQFRRNVSYGHNQSASFRSQQGNTRPRPAYAHSGRYPGPSRFVTQSQNYHVDNFYDTVSHFSTSEDWRRHQGSISTIGEPTRQRKPQSQIKIGLGDDMTTKSEGSQGHELDRLANTDEDRILDHSSLTQGSRIMGKYQYNTTKDFRPANDFKKENDENELTSPFSLSKARGNYNRSKSSSVRLKETKNQQSI